jgi:biopolymer transport protein ExbB
MDALLGFIRSGGVMMYPLILCSIALLAIIVERAISLRRAVVDGDTLLDDVRAAYNGENPEGKSADPAIKVCERQNRKPLARMFARGLRNAHRSADAIEMAMEQEAANELPALEAYLPLIRTIVNIAPLLGLLGTIAGMISSFRAASQAGLSNPTQVLGGISEALISTATGITLAVIGFVCYNYFSNLTRKMIADMEYYGAELVNYLTNRID